MIRLLLADGDVLVREPLAALLEYEDDLTVVAQAEDGESAVALAEELEPDLVMLGQELPGLDGIEAARRILARRGVPIVLLTGRARPGLVTRATAAGVRAVVNKRTPAGRLADILRAVHAGGRHVDSEIAATTLTEGACPLTRRELEALRHVRDGLGAAQIAEQLGLAPVTVRHHLAAAVAKLEAPSRAAAARMADERGWL